MGSIIVRADVPPPKPSHRSNVPAAPPVTHKALNPVADPDF